MNEYNHKVSLNTKNVSEREREGGRGEERRERKRERSECDWGGRLEVLALPAESIPCPSAPPRP